MACGPWPRHKACKHLPVPKWVATSWCQAGRQHWANVAVFWGGWAAAKMAPRAASGGAHVPQAPPAPPGWATGNGAGAKGVAWGGHGAVQSKFSLKLYV